MPPPEMIMKPLIAFLTAPTWDDSRRVLNRHQDMLPLWVEVIDVMLTDPTAVYRGMEPARADRTLRAHRQVLQRCQQVGVSRAFAEIGRRS
jgi:hypothetical protein